MTLCHNFRTGFLTSYQVKNIMPTWVWFSTVTKLWDFNCKWITASGHENTCKLVADMVLFTSNNAKMLHCVYKKSSQ